MHVSVELGFDPASTQRLMDLWIKLADLYNGPHRTELGVQPHLSLTSFSDGEPAFLCRALEALAQRFRAFPVCLGSVGCFPTAEGVIYLAPDPCAALHSIHRTLHERLAIHSELGHPYYRPGNWVPHCTVATDVPAELRTRVMESQALAEATGEVVVETIRAVAYRPARVLYRFPLAAS